MCIQNQFPKESIVTAAINSNLPDSHWSGLRAFLQKRPIPPTGRCCSPCWRSFEHMKKSAGLSILACPVTALVLCLALLTRHSSFLPGSPARISVRSEGPKGGGPSTASTVFSVTRTASACCVRAQKKPTRVDLCKGVSQSHKQDERHRLHLNFYLCRNARWFGWKAKQARSCNSQTCWSKSGG